MRVPSALYLIPAELLGEEQGQPPWLEEHTGAIQVLLALSDLAHVSATGSSIFLNCFYFCYCLNDFLPMWHNDKKMDVSSFTWVLNFYLRYTSLSSSLCIWIERIWTDSRFLQVPDLESRTLSQVPSDNSSQMLFSTQASFLFSSQKRNPTEKERPKCCCPQML